MDIRKINASYTNGGALFFESHKDNFSVERYELYVNEKDVVISEAHSKISVRIKVFDIFRGLNFTVIPDRIDLRFNDVIVISSHSGIPDNFELFLCAIPFTEVWVDIYYPQEFKIEKRVIVNSENQDETIIEGICVIGTLLSNNERNTLHEQVKERKGSAIPYYGKFSLNSEDYLILYSLINLGDVDIVKCDDIFRIMGYKNFADSLFGFITSHH